MEWRLCVLCCEWRGHHYWTEYQFNSGGNSTTYWNLFIIQSPDVWTHTSSLLVPLLMWKRKQREDISRTFVDSISIKSYYQFPTPFCTLINLFKLPVALKEKGVGFFCCWKNQSLYNLDFLNEVKMSIGFVKGGK